MRWQHCCLSRTICVGWPPKPSAWPRSYQLRAAALRFSQREAACSQSAAEEAPRKLAPSAPPVDRAYEAIPLVVARPPALEVLRFRHVDAEALLALRGETRVLLRMPAVAVGVAALSQFTPLHSASLSGKSAQPPSSASVSKASLVTTGKQGLTPLDSQHAFDIARDEVDFEVHPHAGLEARQGGDFERVRNQVDLELGGR